MTILNQNLIPSDLDELYEFCNERYFDNSLPINIDIEWSPRMHKKLGIAISRSNILDDNHTIRLSETLRGNKLKSLGIMVHEMLHIKAYDLYEKTRDNRLLDSRSKYPKNSGFNKGHGPTFHKWKNDLNTKFKELDISAKDDENYDDFEIEEKQYFGIYVQFNTVSDEVYHTIYYSNKDFRENEDTELIDGIKSLYGEDNVIVAKTFSTGSHDIKSSVALTAKGALRKKSALSAYKIDFIEKIFKHPTTQIDPELAISKSNNFPSIDEKLKKIAHYSKGNRGFTFTQYTHSIARLYGKESGNREMQSMPVSKVTSNHDSSFSQDEINYLYDNWNKTDEKDFIALNKNIISSVLSSLRSNKSKESIEDDLNYTLKEKGMFRFDKEDFTENLLRACEAKVKRKGDNLSGNNIELIKELDINFQQLTIDQCLKLTSSFIDKDFKTFEDKALSLLKDNGYTENSTHILSLVKDKYDSVSLSDISETMSQYRFNLLLSEDYNPSEPKDAKEMELILNAFSNRLDKDKVIKTLCENYKQERLSENDSLREVTFKLSNITLENKEEQFEIHNN